MAGVALIVDPEAAVRRAISRAVVEVGVDPLTAQDTAAAEAIARTKAIDVVIADLSVAEALAAAVSDRLPDAPFVVLAAVSDLAAAIAVASAHDGWEALPKPVEPLALAGLAAKRGVERASLRGALRDAADKQEAAGFAELSAVSKAMRAVLRRARDAAGSRAPVLILGDEGVGREALARFIHAHSRRAAKPFVAVACAAIDPDLAGALDTAEGGTLFLSDIDALSPPAQRIVLDLIARGTAGTAADRADPTSAPKNIRVMASIRASLRSAAREGAFDEELYHRLRPWEIAIPPLAARPEDISVIAYQMLGVLRAEMARDVRRVSPEAMRLLRRHPWPGNAAELRQALAHAVASCRTDAIQPSDLPWNAGVPSLPPDALGDEELVGLTFAEAKDRATEAFERRYARALLTAEANNVSGAARRAGMDRSNFKRLLRRVGLAPRRRDRSADEE